MSKEECIQFSKPVKAYVIKAFKENGNLSAAHNFNHVNRVATSAYLVVKVLGGTEREAELARIGGYLHDLVRFPGEDRDDEELSAKKAMPMLRELGSLSESEINTVLASIMTQSVPSELLSTEKKESISYFLADRSRLIRFAVFLGDKIDANGSFVIARRSQFVGGERLVNGDLNNFRKVLESKGIAFDQEVAVTFESYLRLRVKNNVELYPKWFLPVVDRLFDQQKEFYYALLKHQNLHENDIAKLIVSLKYPGADADEIEAYEAKRPESKMQIDISTEGQIDAALEVVKFFSEPRNIDRDTAELIREFDPKTTVAKIWRGNMLAYLDDGIKPLLEYM